MFSPRIAAVAALTVLGAVVGAVASSSDTASSTPPRSIQSGAVVQQAPRAVDVKAENALAGVTGWRIPAALGKAPGLEAYAKALSARPGESVPLVVSAAGAVNVRAFRIGWYGGDRARQVWRGTVQAGVQSGAPTTWRPNGWADTTGWPEGHYLLRLDTASASRFVPLTIRSDSAEGKVLVLTSPLSWQATNPMRDDVSPASSGVTSSSGATGVVSFDRPYARGAGGGGFLAEDAGVLMAAERTGRPLAYATDADLSADPSSATGAAAIVTGSDSRFWPAAGRAALTRAAADGTNLAFFGAGTASRTVKLRDRALTVSKGVSASVKLTGVRPSCSSVSAAPAVTAWTVGDPEWWGYRGTDVERGSTLPGLVGLRADHAAFSAAGSPEALQVLSYGSLVCGGAYSAQSAVYSTRSSGAGVFTAGTGLWSCALTGTCVKSEATRTFTARVTANVIRTFATPEAGRRHPAEDTSGQYPGLSS